MVGRPAPAPERFWAKVQVTPGCWLWLGHIGKNGYGQFWDGTRHIGAHRFSWSLHNGPVPPDLHIDHVHPRCLGRPCPNPDHLEAVSQKINNQRASVLIEKCRHGHDYTDENTYIDRNGWRRCKECNRQRSRNYYLTRENANV